MKKICVFCGKTPSSKNREHILPKWLIELTNSLGKTACLGIDKNTGENRNYSIDSFVFPACTECNLRFSELESQAKNVMNKLLTSEALLMTDFDILLDWFDKVRVGLWLAYYYLDKNIGQINPKFHVASRIGLHDRILQIVRIEGNNKELSFRGCDLPAFYYTPVCFSMIINNYCFINISSAFLVSRNLGFPYANKLYFTENGLAEGEIFQGTNCLTKPILPGWFEFEGTLIYQPMFKWQALIPQFRTYYEDEYIRQNSLEFKQGIGKIFLEKMGVVTTLSSEASFSWVPNTRFNRPSMNPGISINTIHLQIILDNLNPSTEKLSIEAQKWSREMYKSNNDYADKLINTLKYNAAMLVKND